MHKMIIMKQAKKSSPDQSKGLTCSKTYDCLEKRALVATRGGDTG